MMSSTAFAFRGVRFSMFSLPLDFDAPPQTEHCSRASSVKTASIKERAIALAVGFFLIFEKSDFKTYKSVP